jgi:hypothetical protein
MSRLRHPIGPRNGWGTTNPNGHDWVWRNFHEDGPGSRTEGRICRLYIQPTENNPHLPPDYMRMLRTRPKEWQRRFVDASFDTAAGAIWDMWERPVHVVPSTIVGELPVRWYRGRAMDHGRRNPTAVLWGMVDNDGFIIVSDEHYAEGLLPSQHAPIIRAKDEMLAPGINLGPIIAPPDCFRRDSGGHSVADEYRSAADLALTVADDNVDAGLLRVSEWMQRDPELCFPEWHEWGGTYGPDFLSPQQQQLFGREVGRGSPRLFVADRCQNLIAEIPDYRWADLSPTQEEKADAPEKPRKLRDHACFVAGTLVATENGERPIESLRVGERVWTRMGLRDVTAVALTRRWTEVQEVTLSSGRKLVGTPEHPVWADGKWCPLDALRYGATCVHLPPNVQRGGRRARCIRRLSGRFQTAITSITRMATASTTSQAISLLFALKNILRSIRYRSAFVIEDFASPVLVLPSGTDRKKVGRGIESTDYEHGKDANPSRRSANGHPASSDSRHSSRHERGGVRRHADSGVFVRAVRSAGRADVYGLTVEGEHEFFAEGILVSNCDALRYYLMSRPRPFSPPRRVEPDRIARQPSLTHGLLERQF